MSDDEKLAAAMQLVNAVTDAHLLMDSLSRVEQHSPNGYAALEQSRRQFVFAKAALVARLQELLAAARALQEAKREPVLPESRRLYRHYKGGEYELLHAAKIEATHDNVIVYRSLETGEVWVRPTFEFLHKFTPVDAAACKPVGPG